jgi:O-acetyl-ADP-ribose deacetylase (regulator of RNase III)
VIQIVLADITTLRVDAIVNAANPTLAGGGGVDGAIHRAAGPELARAATAHAPCAPGEAVVTPGFALPARFVVHVVGPVWEGGGRGEAETLQRAYESAFRVAREQGIRSIAFPAISTGAYGYPREEAAAIALAAMRRHEREMERIVACLYDEPTLLLYRRLHDESPAA